MIEQQLVELGSRDLVSAIALGTKAVFEIKLHPFGSAGGRDLAAELRHECPIEFFAHAKAIERLHAEGEERLADMKSRKLFPLEENDAPSRFGEQRRCGAAGRAAANDRNVVDVD